MLEVASLSRWQLVDGLVVHGGTVEPVDLWMEWAGEPCLELELHRLLADNLYRPIIDLVVD